MRLARWNAQPLLLRDDKALLLLDRVEIHKRMCHRLIHPHEELQHHERWSRMRTSKENPANQFCQKFSLGARLCLTDDNFLLVWRWYSLEKRANPTSLSEVVNSGKALDTEVSIGSAEEASAHKGGDRFLLRT